MRMSGVDAKDIDMSDRQEPDPNREPSRQTYIEKRSSSTGLWIGVIVAVLVLALLAFLFIRPAGDVATTDTEVQIESSPPAGEEATSPEPAPSPETTAPAEPETAPTEPAEPETAPTEPDTAPTEPAEPPAPAPAQ